MKAFARTSLIALAAAGLLSACAMSDSERGQLNTAVENADRAAKAAEEAAAAANAASAQAAQAAAAARESSEKGGRSHGRGMRK